MFSVEFTMAMPPSFGSAWRGSIGVAASVEAVVVVVRAGTIGVTAGTGSSSGGSSIGAYLTKIVPRMLSVQSPSHALLATVAYTVSVTIALLVFFLSVYPP